MMGAKNDALCRVQTHDDGFFAGNIELKLSLIQCNHIAHKQVILRCFSFSTLNLHLVFTLGKLPDYYNVILLLFDDI